MMPERILVTKTYKLYINGGFPRSESGRSMAVKRGGDVAAHVAQGSRKDLRDAVEAAASAQPKWAEATAYNRGQVLHRMAEMMEGKSEEFVSIILGDKSKSRQVRPHSSGMEEVDASIDRLICFAGWADKYAQVLGCANAVAGPYYNFTAPEATGVVGVVAPDEPALLGLISLIAPPLCAGNAVVAIASDKYPLASAVFGEVCATSDVPAGVINIITGKRSELIGHLAQHREVNAISAANLSGDEATTLKLGSAENVKRVRVIELDDGQWYDPESCEGPWMIEPFVEMKTIWHPSAV